MQVYLIDFLFFFQLDHKSTANRTIRQEKRSRRSKHIFTTALLFFSLSGYSGEYSGCLCAFTLSLFFLLSFSSIGLFFFSHFSLFGNNSWHKHFPLFIFPLSLFLVLATFSKASFFLRIF